VDNVPALPSPIFLPSISTTGSIRRVVLVIKTSAAFFNSSIVISLVDTGRKSEANVRICLRVIPSKTLLDGVISSPVWLMIKTLALGNSEIIPSE